jgi:DNA-binding CsgD family transcriptional regulator
MTLHGLRRLTPAEQRVAALLVQGFPQGEIARRLGRTANTVRNQEHAIYTKLDVTSRAAVLPALLGPGFVRRVVAAIHPKVDRRPG